MNDSSGAAEPLFPSFRAAASSLAHAAWRAVRGVGRLWRKTWRYGAAVLAGLIIAHLGVNLYAGRLLERELTRLRAEGAPLTLADAAVLTVPEAQDARGTYEEVFVRLARGGGQPVILDFVRPLLSAWARTPLSLPRPTLEQVEPIIRRHEADLRLLRDASRLGISNEPADWGPVTDRLPMPIRHKISTEVRFLAAEALVDAHRRRFDDALSAISTMIRMSSHILVEPTVEGQMVGADSVDLAFKVAREVLGMTPPSAGQCWALYDALSHADTTVPYVRAIQAQRAAGVVAFDELRRSRSGDPLMEALWLKATPVDRRIRMCLTKGRLARAWPMLRVAWAPFLKLDEVYYLRFMQRGISISGKPYRETKARYMRMYEELEHGSPWYAAFSRLTALLPIGAVRWRDMARAEIGLMQAALALRAYQIQHGKYPDSLGELRAAGGWAIPDDPFSGKPFIYRRKGEGYLIYSVAEDFKDDGGIDRGTAYERVRKQARQQAAPVFPTYDLPLRMPR